MFRALKEHRKHEREIGEPQAVASYRCLSHPGLCLRLVEPYEYCDATKRALLTIPRGYHFNGASVPKVFHNLVGALDLSISATCVHDFLCDYRGRPPLGTVLPTHTSYTRLETDQLFRRIMDQEGVPEWRELAAYLGVRSYGKLRPFAWERDRRGR